MAACAAPRRRIEACSGADGWAAIQTRLLMLIDLRGRKRWIVTSARRTLHPIYLVRRLKHLHSQSTSFWGNGVAVVHNQGGGPSPLVETGSALEGWTNLLNRARARLERMTISSRWQRNTHIISIGQFELELPSSASVPCKAGVTISKLDRGRYPVYVSKLEWSPAVGVPLDLISILTMRLSIEDGNRSSAIAELKIVHLWEA
jgi:hypothetical protein